MRQGGKWCGQSEAASRAAERREVRRTCGGAHRPPRGERGGAGKAAIGNGARAPSPPPHLSLSPLPLPPLPPQLSSPPSPSPAAAPVRARRQGKKPNAPRRFWRRGGSPHGLGGARRLPWDGWLPLGARARASSGGARGAAKGDKKAPSFPHSGKNTPQNIAIFAPVCYTEHATQFHK